MQDLEIICKIKPKTTYLKRFQVEYGKSSIVPIG
jgi:hypothetical protein